RRGAHQFAGPGHRGGVQCAGDAEVDDPRAVRGEQHVARLEVAVDQPGGVHGAQRLGQADGEHRRGLGRQRAGALDHLAQRAAGHEPGGHPRRLRTGVGVHQRRAEHPADQAGRVDLLGEAGPAVGVGGQVGADRLDRQQPPGAGAPQVHAPHAALAEPGEQPVGAARLGIGGHQGVHGDSGDGGGGGRRCAGDQGQYMPSGFSRGGCRAGAPAPEEGLPPSAERGRRWDGPGTRPAALAGVGRAPARCGRGAGRRTGRAGRRDDAGRARRAGPAAHAFCAVGRSEVERRDAGWAELAGHRAWLRHEELRLLDFGASAALPGRGFGALDADGRPGPGPAETWITGRMAHVYSLAHLRGVPGAGALADHALDGLRGVLRDAEHGGWYAQAAPDGGVPGDATKSAYVNAFVVLGAASATAAGRPGAEQLLAEALSVIETRFLDPETGLGRESFDRTWTTCEDYRGANSGMHLVEAFLAATGTTGDTRWRDRALHIAEFLVHTATAGNGWRLPEHFTADWRVLPEYNA